MSMTKLTIQLVTWNGKRYIPYLFASLRKQTFQDFILQVLDNGSTDGTVAAIEHELTTCTFAHQFIRNQTNSGFVGGHNQLFAEGESEYVLLLNQDMYLMPEYVRRLMMTMEHHADIGATSGRLMRWDFHLLADRGAHGLHHSFTQYIDTLGLKVFRSRRVVDWYAGARWPEVAKTLHESSGAELEVFGISGALPMYRRSAITKVLVDGQLFDPLYFAYKEDVDLAWRLRISGSRAVVVTDAVAYHDRSSSGTAISDVGAAKNRKTKSALANYHSYKNHLYTLIKNEYGANYARDWLWIELYEWKKFWYLLLFEFKSWLAITQIIKHRKTVCRTRRQLKRARSTSAKALRKWWTTYQR